MDIILDPIAVEMTPTTVNVLLAGGHTLSIPMDDLPWLQAASADDRQDYVLEDQSVYWERLEDGFDTEEMLRKYSAKIEKT